MLLHLILLLLEQGRRGKATPQLRTPVERHRHINADPVVVECPNCGELSVAGHYFVEELSAASRKPRWKRINEIYRCGACNQALQAQHFENDGTGVLRTPHWQCTRCAALNGPHDHVCTRCHEARSAPSADPQ